MSKRFKFKDREEQILICVCFVRPCGSSGLCNISGLAFCCGVGSRLIRVNCCWLCLVIDIVCIVLYNSTFLSSWISQLWVVHSCCSLERSRTACQENSRPVSVCGTIFICRLGVCDLNQMPLSFFFFFGFPAIGSTRWRCDSATACHLWKPELSSNLDGPSLEGFGFCQLTLYLAQAVSISFSLSKALRLIKPHKVTNRNQSSAGHLARKSHLRKIIVYCRKSVTLWLQIKESTVKYCFLINWLYTEVFLKKSQWVFHIPTYKK